MPIYKEIANINMFNWKQTTYSIQTNLRNVFKQQSILLPEPNEYIRKIGEHFISFIHKIDTQSNVIQFNSEINMYHKYCSEGVESVTQYWIGEIGMFIIKTVGHKFLKIGVLSGDGEKQLISDVLYIKKLVQQFCNLELEQFYELDSIVIGVMVGKNSGQMNLKEMIN